MIQNRGRVRARNQKGSVAQFVPICFQIPQGRKRISREGSDASQV